MGNFANTLFSVLLGWVQSAVAWLWQLIGSDGSEGAMAWVLDNWLALTIGLCVIGLLIDLVIYLIRWQPYRVWRSFLQRGGDEPPEEQPAEGAVPLQWVYANGEMMPEEARPMPVQAPAASAPEAPVQRVFPARRRRSAWAEDAPADAQPGYHTPYYPPQWRADHQGTDGGTQG